MKPLNYNAVIKSLLFIFILGVYTVKSQSTASFKTSQLKISRVKKAYDTKWPSLEKELKVKKIDPASFDVFIRVFKSEAELELWVKNKNDASFILLKKIAVCATSGSLGPKRREGDGQVPEGIYEVSMFNPLSDYHLALKVSYPNASDRILAKGPTGGDIMIHGNCVTIGCIPLQNEPVEDVFILCIEARNRKSPIRVEIYPCRFSETNLKILKEKASEEKNNFWNNIKPAYEYFETNKQPIKFRVDKKGLYVYN